MSDDREKKYTQEVLDAMKGLEVKIPQPPEPSLPEGHIKYHIVVGTKVIYGSDTKLGIAAELRQLADNLITNQ